MQNNVWCVIWCVMTPLEGRGISSHGLVMSRTCDDKEGRIIAERQFLKHNPQKKPLALHPKPLSEAIRRLPSQSIFRMSTHADLLPDFPESSWFLERRPVGPGEGDMTDWPDQLENFPAVVLSKSGLVSGSVNRCFPEAVVVEAVRARVDELVKVAERGAETTELLP